MPHAQKDIIKAIHSYFVDSIFSATLGVISNCHSVRYLFSTQRNNILPVFTNKVWADKQGPLASIPLQLAQCFSRAVDAPKTGDIVVIKEGDNIKSKSNISEWKVDKFPHYMGHNNSYHSTHILVRRNLLHQLVQGKLYDAVEAKLKTLSATESPTIELDSTLLLKGREQWRSHVKKLCDGYYKEMAGNTIHYVPYCKDALKVKDEVEKSQVADAIIEKYR